MNPKISKLKAERAKNDGKIAMLQSRNREIDEDIIKLENEDIVGLVRATGMTMEELAQYIMHIKKGGSPFCSTQKEDMENAPEEMKFFNTMIDKTTPSCRDSRRRGHAGPHAGAGRTLYPTGNHGRPCAGTGL